MINVLRKEDCCGCTACASICPRDAIIMKPDTLGFAYPIVDNDKCVNCGRCDAVCVFNKPYDTSLAIPYPIAYGARHNDMDEVMTSRSGAAFIAFSDYILKIGGVVYGVGYTDHFRVAHKRATTKHQRDEFKGSKYVQSDLLGIFRQVKADLCMGYTVLFSGTPCQTAGLNSYVGESLRANLILMDIVCHGVPSPYIWRDYVIYLEKKYRDRVWDVNFRDKNEYGWSAHYETYKFENKTHKIKGTAYSDLFNKCISFRSSCGVCKYTNLKRPSDITIGDFWGWEKTDPIINADNKGLSLVLCNTEKGFLLFDKIRENMCVIPVELANCLQPNLLHPTKMHPERLNFEIDYARGGFMYVMKKYSILGWRCELKRLLERCKQIIRHMLSCCR